MIRIAKTGIRQKNMKIQVLIITLLHIHDKLHLYLTEFRAVQNLKKKKVFIATKF